MVVPGTLKPGREACFKYRGGAVPLVLRWFAARLFLHVSNIKADPLDAPAQLQCFIPGVVQAAPRHPLVLVAQRQEDADETKERKCWSWEGTPVPGSSR